MLSGGTPLFSFISYWISCWFSARWFWWCLPPPRPWSSPPPLLFLHSSPNLPVEKKSLWCTCNWRKKLDWGLLMIRAVMFVNLQSPDDVPRKIISPWPVGVGTELETRRRRENGKRGRFDDPLPAWPLCHSLEGEQAPLQPSLWIPVNHLLHFY